MLRPCGSGADSWRCSLSQNFVRQITHWISARLRCGKGDREQAVQSLLSLDSLLEKILVFAASIESTSPSDWDVGLWRTGPLQEPWYDPTPVEPVKLRAQLDDAPDVFSDLIRNDGGDPVQRDAAAVYDDLENNAEELSTGGHQGYGRVVAAAYRAARLS